MWTSIVSLCVKDLWKTLRQKITQDIVLSFVSAVLESLGICLLLTIRMRLPHNCLKQKMFKRIYRTFPWLVHWVERNMEVGDKSVLSRKWMYKNWASHFHIYLHRSKVHSNLSQRLSVVKICLSDWEMRFSSYHEHDNSEVRSSSCIKWNPPHEADIDSMMWKATKSIIRLNHLLCCNGYNQHTRKNKNFLPTE